MRRKTLFTFLVLGIFCALLVVGVHASVTGSTASPVPLDLAGKIAVVAGIVATVLQGIKKWMPQIGGTTAVLMNVVLSLAMTYAANPSLDVQFFITALGAALAAAGVHSFLRPVGVTSTAAPTAPGKGS